MNNKYTIDNFNKEILLSHNNSQVMMEWEKPYMQASIDMLQPIGNVLEIGFGCGYSASQIMKYKPSSYTVIECDPIVIEKAKLWKKNYPDINISIVEDTWQNKLHTLGKFDQIYFDDHPLNNDRKLSYIERGIIDLRFNAFLELCIQEHTTIQSRMSWYINGNGTPVLPSDCEPFVTLLTKTINIDIPSNCTYRNKNEQKCTIPLLTKIKEYSFEEAQLYALKYIM